MLSIVIPIHNEEPSILPLYDRLTAVLEAVAAALRNPLRRRRLHRPQLRTAGQPGGDRCAPEGDPPAPQLRPDRGALRGLPRSQGRRHHRHGRRSAARARRHSRAAREDRRRLRHRQRLAQGPRGQRHHAQDSVAHRQLADGEGLRRRTARFRHHLQGLSRRSAEGRQPLRRTAPLHSRAGQFLRRARGRSAHPQHAARRAAIRTTASAARSACCSTSSPSSSC